MKTPFSLRFVLLLLVIWIALLLSGCGAADAMPQAEELPAPLVGAEPEAPADSVEQEVQEEEPAPEAPAAEAPAAEVDWLYHGAYMQGADGFFFPDRSLLRAEAAKLLVNLFGPSKTAAVYWDVSETDWFYSCAYGAAGYLQADPARGFRPYDAITPAEFVTAVAVAVGEDTCTLEQAVELGWLDAEAAAQTAVTRAQTAEIVNRATGRQPDQAVLEALQTPVFLDVDRSHPQYLQILEAAIDHVYYTDTLPEHWHPEIMQGEQLPEGVHCGPDAAYYVAEDGQVVQTPGLFEAESGVYLIREDGQAAVDTLELLNGKVIYLDADGVMLKDGAWGEYLFDADGFYTTGDEMLDALVAHTLELCTTEDMTREEKLRACYDYVRAYRYLGRNSALPTTCKTIPMENAMAYATKIFETGKGDCYNFAAAFCFLARALGYEAMPIAGSCGYVWSNVAITHGWVEITLEDQVWLFDPQIENYNIRAGISNETHSAYQVDYAHAPGRYYKN